MIFWSVFAELKEKLLVAASLFKFLAVFPTADASRRIIIFTVGYG